MAQLRPEGAMRGLEMGWTALRWLYALFFFVTGIVAALSLTVGWPPAIRQPTPEAQALYSALHDSGFIEPVLAASYLVGGAALAIRRTAPLGLILLAPSVVVIGFFDTWLARLPLPGLLTPAIWGALALRHFRGFRGLWTYGTDAG